MRLPQQDLTSGLQLPPWAWAILAGVAMYGWTENRFPSREEENLKHTAIVSQFKDVNDRIKIDRNDLEARIKEVAALIEKHAQQPFHGQSGQDLALHGTRITTLEQNSRDIAVRLETNEQLLREIKTALDQGRRR